MSDEKTLFPCQKPCFTQRNVISFLPLNVFESIKNYNSKRYSFIYLYSRVTSSERISAIFKRNLGESHYKLYVQKESLSHDNL